MVGADRRPPRAVHDEAHRIADRDRSRRHEYGPGAMLGERAALEGGTRTSTLVAVTRCRVASVPAVQLDLSDLAELATGHRREEGVRG